MNIKRKQEAANKEMITPELLSQLTFAQKISSVGAIRDEIISFPAFRYRKLRDLLTFCEDPRDIDVVLKAVTALCEVFCDIIPSYRVRELSDKEKDDQGGEKNGSKPIKISKEVEALQTQE